MWCLVPSLVPELVGCLALVLMEGSQGEVACCVSCRTKIEILRVRTVSVVQTQPTSQRALVHTK